MGTERDLRLCQARVGPPLGFLLPGVFTPTATARSVLLGKLPPALASHGTPPAPQNSAPLARMCSPHQPARRTGPLSVLPPKPNLSQNGGAQWASQWQFFLLLHTCRGGRGEGHEREAELGWPAPGAEAPWPSQGPEARAPSAPTQPDSVDVTVRTSPKRHRHRRPGPGAACVTCSCHCACLVAAVQGMVTTDRASPLPTPAAPQIPGPSS